MIKNWGKKPKNSKYLILWCNACRFLKKYSDVNLFIPVKKSILYDLWNHHSFKNINIFSWLIDQFRDSLTILGNIFHKFKAYHFSIEYNKTRIGII